MASLRKNVAGQTVNVQLNKTADGTACTTGGAYNVVIDTGAQGAGAGTMTHKGGGQWQCAPTQAETNGTCIGLQFTGTGAIAVGFNIFTDTYSAGGLPSVDVAGFSYTSTITLSGFASNITGNLSGSVGSVTGAVGSVTGAVGSVTGAVGSVTGAVGSVTGNVGGNVAGSVNSVTTGVIVTTNNDKTGYTASLATSDATKLDNIVQIHGLDLTKDLAVSTTARTVGTIVQSITTAAGTTTVHRSA